MEKILLDVNGMIPGDRLLVILENLEKAGNENKYNIANINNRLDLIEASLSTVLEVVKENNIAVNEVLKK